MLRGLPHSFEETAVLLSSFQHIKDQCFYFLVCLGLMLWGGTAEEDPRVAPLSSSTSSGQPVYRFDMCIYSFSAALWSLFHTTTASVSFRKYPIWAFFCFNSSPLSPSFFMLGQILSHVFSFHYSYNWPVVLFCPVLFMEVTFCGCSYETNFSKPQAVLNFSTGKAVHWIVFILYAILQKTFWHFTARC